ncbi:MAG: hypothetical protein GXY45_00135 [Ramlibacter sp.]|nr:hypothetical protein [Ramlibacter sp.]
MDLQSSRFRNETLPAGSTRLRLLPVAAVLAASLTAAAPALAQPALQDIAVAAATCFNCHGTDGRASSFIPSIAGQSEHFLLQRMQDFKAGQAPHVTVMTRLMKGYSDAELQGLAKYFSEVPR